MQSEYRQSNVRFVGGTMKMRILIVGIMLVASTVFATLYKWPQNKRPLVPIDKAYSQALGELHNKLGSNSTNYYCVNILLTGNKEQDGKNGLWTFSFDSKKNVTVYVYVSMTGEVSMY